MSLNPKLEIQHVIGYCATWKVEKGRIYLTDIKSPLQIRSGKGYNSNDPISTMQKLFPGGPEVFAHWINGTLKIQSGELFRTHSYGI